MNSKAKRLLSWLCVLALCMSLLPMTALAAGDGTTKSVSTGPESPVQITKRLSGSGTTEDPYELTMEAYVGGTVTPSSTVPLDIVLVLDQSGSMDDSFSQNTNITYTPYKNSTNRQLASQDNLWYKLDDGTYVRVNVIQKRTPTYEKMENLTNNGGSRLETDYWENRNNLYQLQEDGTYEQVHLNRDWTATGLFNGYYTYTYTFPNGATVLSKGDDTTPQFDDNGPLYLAVEGEVTYTYWYQGQGGTQQTITTSEGRTGIPDKIFYYQRSSTETISRMEALKTAAKNFAQEVANNAKGADGESDTNDDVNHRIAVVGFAYDRDGSYHNTELFIGRNSYTYGWNATQSYDEAFQSMETQQGASNVQASIDALDANGSTYVNYGLDMAVGILEANPVNENEARERVVIVFTDGSPGQNGTWGRFGDADETADDAIARASEIKEIGATIYTVGVFPGADAAFPIPAFTNDNDYATSNANRFMHLVSSNYPSAEDMSNPRERNPDLNGKSFYLSASDADSLNGVFNEIAEEIQPTVTVDEDSVLSDTLSAYFDFGNISVGDSNIVTEGVTVQKWKATGNGSTPTWEQTGTIENAKVTIDGDKISVTGFDYSAEENVVVQKDGTWQGYKLVITFPIAVDTVACLKATDIQNNLYPTNSIAKGSEAGLTYGENSTLLDASPTVKLENLTANGTDVTVQVYVDGELVTNPQEYVTLSRDTTDTTYNYFNLVSNNAGTLTYDFDYNPDPESGHDCVDISVAVTGGTYLLQGITSYQSHGKNGTDNVIAKGDTYTVDNVTHNDSASPDVKIFLRTKYSVQYYQNETLLNDTYVDETTYLAGEDVSATTEENNYPTTEDPVQMNWKNAGYSTTISLKDLPNEEGLTVDGWFLGSTTGTEYDPSSGTSVNVSAVSNSAENNVIKFYATSEAITPTITVSVTNGTAKSGSDFTLDSTSDTASTGTFTVAYEGSATITFAPQEGYALDSVKVNGAYVAFDALNNGTYAFSSVINDQSIEVVYALDENDDGVPDKHQATVTYQVVNGTWDGEDSENKEEVFTIEQYNPNTGNWDSIEATLGNTIPENMQPNEGFTAEGAWNQTISSETQVTGDVTYTYTFGDKLQYTITVEVVNGRASAIDLSATEDGDASVYHGTVSAEYGADVTINFQGDTGYALDSVTVDDQTAALTGESNYTFNDVSANHTIQVVYEADENKDNIPDKYQVFVKFESANTEQGTVSDRANAEENTGINQVYTFEGHATSGNVTPSLAGVEVTAKEDFVFTNSWTKDDGGTQVDPTDTLENVNGGTTITFYAHFTGKNPNLTVEKSVKVNGEAYDGSVVPAGTELTYTITVTNTGNTTFDSVTVKDSMWGEGKVETISIEDVNYPCSVDGGYWNAVTPDGPWGSLDWLEPDDIWTCTYTYTVTEDDVEKGSITNVATATGGDNTTGKDEQIVWTNGVVVTPADITLYTGGTGYSGIVGNNGELVENEGNGLPEPGYYIQLPDALNEALLEELNLPAGTILDLSQYVEFTYDDNNGTTRTWSLELYDKDGNSKVSDGRYVYRLLPTADSQDPVRLQITGDTVDGNKVLTNDQFTIDLGSDLFRKYDMAIYSGDLDLGYVKLTFKDDNKLDDLAGKSYTVNTASGELTIRGVTGQEETAVVDQETKSGFSASVPEGTTYTINDSEIGVNDPSNIQLLVDNIVTEGASSDAVTNALESKTTEALQKENVTLENPTYDKKYMDLVDGNNGNVYVTPSNEVTITWPVPDDAAEDTDFYVVHFDGLDREFSGKDAVTQIESCEKVTVIPTETSSDGQSVTFTTSTFSPFVLVYEKAPDPVPTLDVTKTLTAVNSHTPGTSVSVGDELTYTITVTNTGNVDLTNVTVTDTLSNGRTVTWANLPDGVTNTNGTLTIASLTAEASVELTATYKVQKSDANGTLTNAVTVNGTTPGGGENPTDEDTEETPVDPYYPPAPPVDPPELNTEDHYAYIVGYPDGTVRPEGNITRAEVATIFFRLLTDESRDEFWSQTNPYSDVSADDWYNNAVSTLTNAGILDGYEDGTFRPNGNITRAEFATITSRFFDATYEGEDLFPDISGHWAQKYINESANAGIVNGYEDGTFRPQKLITRAEAMTMVNRTIDRHPDAEHLLDDMIVWPDNLETAWYYEQVQEATNSHTYTMHTDAEKNPYEIWSELLPVRDWAQLEKEWSDAHSGQTGGEVV